MENEVFLYASHSASERDTETLQASKENIIAPSKYCLMLRSLLHKGLGKETQTDFGFGLCCFPGKMGFHYADQTLVW